MTDKPRIVLVHGAFADGSHWRHIIPRLYEAGHRLMAAQNPLTSLADDIATTRKLAEWIGGPTLLGGPVPRWRRRPRTEASTSGSQR
jgi:pimeloyl-ACP methyl ester carboxylesterase